MAENQDRDQRTEQPTPKRLQDAREKGQVPRSRELTGMAVMVTGAATLMLTGGQLASALGDLMRSSFSFTRESFAQPEQMTGVLGDAVIAALLALAPLFLAVVAAAVLAPMALGGWVLSAQALTPDPARLNPLNGLKRIFGVQGLSELLKAVAKFLVVGSAAVFVVWTLLDDLMHLGAMPVTVAIGQAGWLLALAALLMSAALMLIAAVDAPFQAWSHRRNLRMTKQQVREEMKETEGRPEVKSRIRAAQRELARRRMMQEVPKADVVVTNPTHYSVALRYDATRMRAPRVVAKGRDLVALEIRRVAREHGVAVFEAPPLARAIYASTALNREVPTALYIAVAQVLSYVFQLRAAGRDGLARTAARSRRWMQRWCRHDPALSRHDAAGVWSQRPGHPACCCW